MGLNIAVKDSLKNPYDPSGAPEMRRQAGKSPLYKVHIYLDGNDVLFVNSATYHLHQTFDQPVRTVSRSIRNPNCSLAIWTWGIFTVRVIVEDKSGQKYEFVHPLTYGAEIERTPQSVFRQAS